MPFKKLSRLFLAFALIFAQIATPVLTHAFALETNASSITDDLSARLAALEQKIEAKRQELGVTGASLVIVKDDKIIYIKGLGYKDFERKIPVTPDTLFAIGSTTKAFTAMSVMMSIDEGKMSLDDSPKKFLPYFKLQDTDADAKITLRDLLSHSSGLNRTDLAMISGAFNREELIKIAGQAKPTAKLREKFQYQNIMFVVAGEAVAKTQGTTYEKFIADRIFKPLGMTMSNLSVRDMQKSKDCSHGYSYIAATKETVEMPPREIDYIAPAGSINSNARDMAQWLRLMLGGGVFEGKRLVSEKSFNELISPQMKIQGKTAYGLGWFLRDWNGHKVIEHGGNIDGFSAQVGLMPDQHIGFALLTNQNNTTIVNFAMNTIWTELVGTPDAPQQVADNISGLKVESQREAGTYKLTEAGIDFEVVFKDGKLILSVPGQPTYPLENIVGRRYKFASPAPDGFYITFRPKKDDANEAEAYLEQPQGNYVLPKLKSSDVETVRAADAKRAEQFKELIGSYQSEKGSATIDIALKDGKVSLVAPAQPPYALVEKEKDIFALTPLPDEYRLFIKRDANGKVTGIRLKQPEGTFDFKRAGDFVAPLSVDELMSKEIAAAGGVENLRKYHSMVMIADLDFVHQGVTAQSISHTKAPNLSEMSLTFNALGKNFGTLHEYFDGTKGGEEGSFLPSETYAGKKLAQAKLNADFYQLLNWKTLFKKVEITKKDKIGDEEVFVVRKTPAPEGNAITDYVSTKTFLVIKRDSLETLNDADITLPVTETFSDFRAIGGLVMPFKIVQHTLTMGDVIMQVKDVKLDAEIPDATFRASAAKQ